MKLSFLKLKCLEQSHEIKLLQDKVKSLSDDLLSAKVLEAKGKHTLVKGRAIIKKMKIKDCTLSVPNTVEF